MRAFSLPVRLPSRHFVLLWQGQFVSHLGNQAFLIATTLYLQERTGSAAVVAAAMMAATLPLVLAAPLGGTVADRHSRRAILIVADVARAMAVGGLALAVVSGPPTASANIVLIVAVAAINGIMGALFAPAFQAFVPDLVPGDRLATANSINQASVQASTLVGQALGGLLYVAWGPGLLLLLDAISYAYAGFVTWLLPRDRRVPERTRGVEKALYQYARDTWQGLTYLRARPGMWAVLAIFAGVNCLFMPVFVLLPFYTRSVLGAGAEWYGFLLSGAGSGALAGSLIAGMVLPAVRARAAAVRVCLSGVAAGVLLLALTRSAAIALLAFVAIGALSSFINVAVITAFQSAVPADMRGRVMALVIALSTAAVPIGMAAGGAAGDLWPDSLPAVIGAAGAAIAMVAAVSWTPSAGALFQPPAARAGER